jgi:hypothetical protein
MRKVLQGYVVGTRLGLYPMAYFGISSVEPSDSACRVLFKTNFHGTNTEKMKGILNLR